MAKGIYKRKKSKFYWICYTGLDGKLVRESSGSDEFRDAKLLLNKRRREIDEGKEPQVKKIATTRSLNLQRSILNGLTEDTAPQGTRSISYGNSLTGSMLHPYADSTQYLSINYRQTS